MSIHEYPHPKCDRAIGFWGDIAVNHFPVSWMPCTGDDDSQVREYLRTWSINWLTVKRMAFQVRMVLHTRKSGTPTGCPVPGTMTLRCVNISAPGTSTNCQSGRWRSRCAWFLASGSLVPNTFRSAVCTPETFLLYPNWPGRVFVPQKA